MYKGIAFDFDEVLVNSIEAIVSILNEDYNLHAKASDVNRWDFKDAYPTLTFEQINNVWNDKRLFQRLTFKPNTIETLEDLSKKYPLIIYSAGSSKNLQLKKDFIKNNILIKKINLNFIGVLEGIEDKSLLDLKDWVFIDDNQKNLYDSNASLKILFRNRENADWNNNWNETEINNIKQIYNYV